MENTEFQIETIPPFGGMSLAKLILGYEEGTIYNLTSQDLLPHFKLRNGRIQFCAADLIQWMKNGGVSSGQPKKPTTSNIRKFTSKAGNKKTAEL